MINLVVELVCKNNESELRMRSFLKALSRGIGLGLFSSSNYEELAAIQLKGIQRTEGVLRMSIEIPSLSVAVPIIIESIFLPVLDLEECPSVLKTILFETSSVADSQPLPYPMANVEKFVSKGLITTPEIFDYTQPVSIWIELTAPLDTVQIENFRQSIEIFEKLLGSAPFLSCESQEYSVLGQTQLNWLGSTEIQYWAEAIATSALWLPMITNLLFSGVAIPGVERVEIEQ